MKKYIAMSALMLASVSFTANAQKAKQHFYSENFEDNIYVSVAGGAQLCVNPDNKDYGFGKAITPQIQISLGKWFNPVWGIRLQGAGVWSKMYMKTTFKNDNTIYDEYNKTSKKFATVRFDAMYNLSNAIYGYNPDRLFGLSVFAGPGLTFAKTYGNQDKVNALINGNLGLQANFNVSRYFDVFVEAAGEVSPSIFGKYSNAHTDGAVSLVAGVAYTFGGKHFVSCGIDQAQIDALNNQLNNARAELAASQAELEKAKKNVDTKVSTVVETKEVPVLAPRAYFFKISGSKLTAEDKVNIKLAADFIKKNPSNKKYKIAGYADETTGSKKFNQSISEKRAKAVADALIAEGVSADQLEIVGCGATPDMFGAAYLNRVVIME